MKLIETVSRKPLISTDAALRILDGPVDQVMLIAVAFACGLPLPKFESTP